MRAFLIALAVASVSTVSGCGGKTAFECTENAQCTVQGLQGTCQPTGFCSFPDGSCPSGERYGTYAGSDFAGECVDESIADDGGSSAGSEADTTATDATGDGDGDGDTGDGDGDGDDTGDGDGDGDAAGDGDGDGDGGIGSPCQMDVDCGDACLRCEGQQCEAKVGDPGDCDPCEACNGSGVCDPIAATDAPCDSGTTLQCSDYVWEEGMETGNNACFALTANELTGQCDGSGGCTAPTPMDCPYEKGDAIVECDTRCTAPSNNCSPYVTAADVTVQTMCITSGETALCNSSCANNTDSQVTIRSCVSDGDCSNLMFISCGNYRCTPDLEDCLTSCEDDNDCITFTTCSGMMCG